jgi:hypothetical protein
MNTFKQTLLGIITITIFVLPSLKSFGMIIPVTGELVSDEITCSFDINFNNKLSLDGETQKTGHQDYLEIYAKGKFNLEIVEQGNKGGSYVSSNPDVLTFFSLSKKFGSIGLVAHNFLSGEEFYELEEGDIIHIKNGSSEIHAFRVSESLSYQAIEPKSVRSDFVDLETGEFLNTKELFMRTYGRSGKLILQTCIERDGNYEWGRYFIIAESIIL